RPHQRSPHPGSRPHRRPGDVRAVTRNRLANAAAVLALPLVLLAAPSPATGAADDGPLAGAKNAAQSADLAGEVEVRWVDQQGHDQHATAYVTARDGTLRVGDGDASRLVASKAQQWLNQKGAWALVSDDDLSGRAP